jgi:hypothetical protein
MFSLVFLPKRFLSLAPPPGGAWSCAGLRLSKNSLPAPLFSAPRSFRKRVQKYYLFPIPQALFSSFFLLSRISLIVRRKKLQNKK